MASFTDNPQLLANFNPYVEQLPVDAMREVGMYKQAKYDEGVQKIQTAIDNVAGLDIMHDTDKGYLQSKLSELGNNLKTVAAGDFSNFQLVNSTAGMASAIANDKNIQSAVISTSNIRKGQKEIDKARSEGKSSPQNEDFFNTQVNKYLENQEVGQLFNGRYKQYIDLTDKYNKVAKDVEAVEYSYDQPYKTNADGSLRYFTKDKSGNLVETTKDKGQPVLDDAMKTITKKGKAAQTLFNNFLSSTSEADREQLAIDAAYHYKNATPDTFKKDIVDIFDLKKKQTNAYITELTVALKNPKIPDADKARMQAELTKEQDKIDSGYFEKEVASSLKTLEDPANLKSFADKFYTQKYLTQLAQDKSTESYTEALGTNPYAQMNMEKKKFQFDVQRENRRINEWNTDHQFEVFKWQTERQDKIAAKIEEDRKKLGGEPITNDGTLRTDIPKVIVSDINSKINANNKQLAMLDAEFLSQNKNYSKKTLDTFADAYDKDPNSLDLKDNDLRLYLNRRRQLDHSNIRNYSLIKGANAATADIDDKIDKELRSYGGVVDKNGKELFNSKELYLVGKKLDKLTKVTQVYDPVSEATKSVLKFDRKGAEAILNQYKGTKYETIARAYINYNTGKPLSYSEQIVYNKAKKISEVATPVVSGLFKQKLDTEADYLTQKMPENFSMSGTLNKKNDIDMQNTTALISDSMNPELGALDLRRLKDFDAETVQKWRTDDAKLDYRIVKNYDGSGELIIQNGKEIQKIPMTAETFNSYYPRYAQTNPVTRIKSMILASPTNTTNINKRGDAVNAQFTGYELPALKGTTLAKNVRFDIEGAKSNVGGKVDGYQVRLYAFDGKVWHNTILNQQGYIGEEQIQDAINLIGVDAVKHTLKQ
jgi:hypothetical protein